MRGVRAALAAVVSLAVAIGLPAASAKPTVDSKTSRALVLYSAGGRIFTVRANGTHRTALTKKGPGPPRFLEDSGPTWSPDAGHIAFSREGVGGHVYVMRADGSHARELTRRKGAYDYAPAWSPDGTQIAFVRVIQRRTVVVDEVVVVGIDGSSPTVVHRVRLTDSTSAADARLAGELTYSPDGATLLLSEFRFDERPSGRVLLRRSLYSIPATGGDETLIAKHAYGPSFSPSGARMTYVSEADKNGIECYEECFFDGEVYLADADGGNPRRLTHTKLDEESPDWSADGRRIVYSGERKPRGNMQLYSVQVQGQCVPTRLTRAKHGAHDPDWQPAPARSSDPGVCGIPVSGSR